MTDTNFNQENNMTTAIPTTPIRSLPKADQIEIQQLAREIMAQADGLLTKRVAIATARMELGK